MANVDHGQEQDNEPNIPIDDWNLISDSVDINNSSTLPNECSQIDVNRDSVSTEISEQKTHSLLSPCHNNIQINEKVDSSSPFSMSKTKSSIEIDDSEISTILNICKNSNREISIQEKKNLTNKTNSKPIIEVLSDSNDFCANSESIDISVNDLSLIEFEELNRPEELHLNDHSIELMNNKIKTENTDFDEISECPCPTVISIDNDRSWNKNEIKTNTTTTIKSSSITFFCENLDELKESYSDSYESLEDI